jgi:hypothetical protein
MTELLSLSQNKKNILHYAYVRHLRVKHYKSGVKSKNRRMIEVLLLFNNQTLDDSIIDEYEWVLTCDRLSIIDYVGGMNIVRSYFRLRKDNLLPFISCT